MSTTRLRPLEVGEILDVGIKAYTTNARTLIAIGAIVGIPFQLLSGVIQLSTVSSASQLNGSSAFSGGSANMVGDYSRARIAGLLVTSLIGAVVSLLLTAATLKAVSDAYLGTAPSVRDSLRFALRRMRSLGWLYLLFAIGLTLAFVALVLPAIWLYVAWSVAAPALLLEDVRGTAALRRSFRLVRGRWWPTAGVLLVAGLIVSIGTFVLGGLLQAVSILTDSSSVLLAVIASTLASSVTAAIIRPVQGAVTTVLYFDLRVRKDGFDLALLAARLGLPPATGPASWLPQAGRPPTARDCSGAATEAPSFWPPPPGWKPAGQTHPAAEGEPDPSTSETPPFWPPPPGWKPPGGAAKHDRTQE